MNHEIKNIIVSQLDQLLSQTKRKRLNVLIIEFLGADVFLKPPISLFAILQSELPQVPINYRQFAAFIKRYKESPLGIKNKAFLNNFGDGRLPFNTNSNKMNDFKEINHNLATDPVIEGLKEGKSINQVIKEYDFPLNPEEKSTNFFDKNNKIDPKYFKNK